MSVIVCANLTGNAVIFKRLSKGLQIYTSLPIDVCNDYRPYLSGADPGFFLGGGAPLRNDVTDGEVKHFKSEYIYTKTKASSQGGVRTPAPSP